MERNIERQYEPAAIGDEDVVYFIEELIEASRSVRHDPLSGDDDDDTVTVCLLCNDVEGHVDGCPIPILDKVVDLSYKARGATRHA